MKMKLNIASKLIVTTTAMITLCSCAVSVQQPTTYSLTEIPGNHQSYRTNKILMVLPPDAAPYYRTTQMAYEMKPHQVSYFTRNAWAEPPAQMLQPLLVKTLQNSNHFRAIVTPPVTGVYDYMLNTQIMTLRVNLDTRPTMVEVVIRAQIFNARSNRVVSTKNISIFEPVKGCSFYDRVLAANRAIAKALTQINKFCTRTIH
jgi:cholesterol transport system auxiliary component